MEQTKRSEPTAYPDLNAVLVELVTAAQEILAEDFCGAYLQGSFALGAADEHSDVDFVVVTNEAVSRQQFVRLQSMHVRIHALATPWAQHLEGSYIPKDSLRHVDPARTPYPFLDNGASELVWDNHCNTAVVRWTLREHGVVLSGPDPASLIEPVSADHLRREARAKIREYVDWAFELMEAGCMSRWTQPYLVLTLCRLLYTLDAARVASKRVAGEWAIGALNPAWASLIQAALDDRPDPWQRVHQSAAPELADRTLAFADYVLAEVAE